ncbi:hypothetical protein [Streptomyces sp. V1I6]|uniref:hypothetical protein n=1 Tax=Streptomyces sp. V1I6 TaxID=3042273 RepID=UPI0027D8377A|nr:hypothetical protein [Streptomyces sp. V1I6]
MYSTSNLVASAVASALWTAFSPAVAFGCLPGLTVIALAGLLLLGKVTATTPQG